MKHLKRIFESDEDKNKMENKQKSSEIGLLII